MDGILHWSDAVGYFGNDIERHRNALGKGAKLRSQHMAFFAVDLRMVTPRVWSAVGVNTLSEN